MIGDVGWLRSSHPYDQCVRTMEAQYDESATAMNPPRLVFATTINFSTRVFPQLPYHSGITTLPRRALRGTFLVQPIEDHYATT